jgi:hypothetical protein
MSDLLQLYQKPVYLLVFALLVRALFSAASNSPANMFLITWVSATSVVRCRHANPAFTLLEADRAPAARLAKKVYDIEFREWLGGGGD